MFLEAQSVSYLKETQMGNVAQFDLMRRVTHFDRRVVIGLAMIGRRSRALRGFKETQLTRIANLAIRELLTLTRYI